MRLHGAVEIKLRDRTAAMIKFQELALSDQHRPLTGDPLDPRLVDAVLDEVDGAL